MIENDADLLNQLRSGAPGAAEAFDRTYRAGLIRFASGYLRSVDEAEDAVQDVFAKVWKTDDSPNNLRVWLYAVTRNHCLNLLRGKGRRPDAMPMRSDIELAASCTGQPTRIARIEEYQRIEKLVSALSDGEREILRMRYGEELSRDEIATILEVPVSTVKSRLFEVMKKLRAHGSP